MNTTVGDGVGLKDHQNAKSSLKYYSPDAPPGANTLVINLKALEPEYFDGIVSFTDAQEDAISAYYRKYKKDWIENIVRGIVIEDLEVTRKTIGVLQRSSGERLAYTSRAENSLC